MEELDADESDAEESGAEEPDEELDAGEPKDEVKEPDGEGDELGEGVKDVAEDVKELAGLSWLSCLAGLSSTTSGALVARALISVEAAGTTGVSTGRSLTRSARRAFTASASLASVRLTLVPLA